MLGMFDYNFNLNEELKIYENIGSAKQFYNYGEWEAYVLRKYSKNEYTKKTLRNFKHYLKRNQKVVVSKKEMWSSTIMPMVILIITILFTAVFSIIGVINNYNNAINTCTSEEFMEYSGYTAKMIYDALEQNLYSGMYFYIFGMIIMSWVIIFLIIIMSSKISNYNLKESFYDDYIRIIEDIIEKRDITA